ncbi:MAG TPA: hypothetical protein DCR93_13285 [Cytophagales bacterium]|nr:hypothetical protein [Cytophagales bacterium]HAP60415.1 hypothetical protein [Cytophagales bacterium]
MILKRAIQVLSSIGILISILWFYFEPGFEPFITTLAGIVGLLGTSESNPKKWLIRNTSRNSGKRTDILYIDDDLLRTRLEMLKSGGFKVTPVNDANLILLRVLFYPLWGI